MNLTACHLGPTDYREGLELQRGLVDARASGEIGDLLTTAQTPGHAMSASDSTRSHGAVIGKAMTRLTAGEKGLEKEHRGGGSRRGNGLEGELRLRRGGAVGGRRRQHGEGQNEKAREVRG